MPAHACQVGFDLIEMMNFLLSLFEQILPLAVKLSKPWLASRPNETWRKLLEFIRVISFEEEDYVVAAVSSEDLLRC